MKKTHFKRLSIICLIVSLLVWLPNIIFNVSSQLWVVTFIIAPVGIVFAALIKKNSLIIANTFMFFSFFIFMFFGYIVNFITDGNP
ncbi:hypothetical protein [Guptibacillus algicola]|uniref:hypothetical protein n=1 Tax=Guptibacillus algicola TaxID=225844 RepID=UPI001CD628AA|nr:hypothetical protein [Alkalihalobacillus algicola]MCA0987756.1 hypothetical protein [Alkalihalobacillus algicola]